MGGLALEVLDPIVIGEGDVEALRLVDRHADQVRLPAGDHAVLADHQRQPIGRAALERLVVDRPDELDRRHVPLGRGTVVDRPQGGLLLAQLGDDALHLLIGDGWNLQGEGVAGVGAQRHLRPDRHRRRESDRLTLRHAGRVDIDLRLVDGDDGDLVQRGVVRVADQVVDRLGDDRLAPHEPVDHVLAAPCRAGSRAPSSARRRGGRRWRNGGRPREPGPRCRAGRATRAAGWTRR